MNDFMREYGGFILGALLVIGASGLYYIYYIDNQDAIYIGTFSSDDLPQEITISFGNVTIEGIPENCTATADGKLIKDGASVKYGSLIDIDCTQSAQDKAGVKK